MYTEELGGELSQSDQGLVRQAAAISVHAERLQAAIVAGQDVDSDQVIRLRSECRRILGSLTAKGAKNKPEANTLQQYLAERAARAADAPERAEPT